MCCVHMKNDMNFKNRTMRLTLLYEKKVTKELGAAAKSLALGLQKCKESVLAVNPSFLFHMKVTESKKILGGF